MTDKLTQPALDRLLAFASSETPNEHDEIVAQYCLWYGLSASVWCAVVLGSETVERPTRMGEWRHYLEAIGYT